ncbi:heat-inducible transcriptional repressor HrcA [Nakamurella aerolata]|uniref:Heat-inducible transcription repressor HrcA n=1 Tax=Nakamurella aerolata TaxID=1656892 RepID=A0A849ABI7_9ACTN|nr:heat-inducible transcriptional repressor HrcA [Nakamurella aerolata]NNG36511.1 heat-inducible transcriptional repressor HrcA [Nakamurella aerolata]
MRADDRRFRVLRAIVADYVATQEPVGSKTLVDRHQLGVSSATVRNDMAVLEEEGYITQPHTSAGRIPTDKGYRLFVDRLTKVKPLSAGERNAIEGFLSKAVDLDDVLRRSVRLLAQLTRQVAVVQYPTLVRSAVRHIELVGLSETRLLAVVITDTGRVEQRTLDLSRPVSAEQVQRLRMLVAEQATGQRLDQAAEALHAIGDTGSGVPVDAESAEMAGLLGTLLESLVEHPDERLVLSGTSNITGSFADPPSLRGVLEALDEQVTLLKLLAVLEHPEAMRVSIGQENLDVNLSGTSLVATGYGSGEVLMGGLAVVGPTRMDYPGTIAAVRAVAQYVGMMLSEN